MPRQARSPRPPRRRHVLKVRLDDAEAAALRERTLATRARSVAGYVRTAALGQPVPVAARASAPALNREQHVALARTAGNLNQIARHLNQGTILTDRDLLPVLRQLYEDVQQVRRLLLGTASASETAGPS